MAANTESTLLKEQSRDGAGLSAVYLEPGARWGIDAPRVYVKRQDAYWCRPPWRLFRKTPVLRREVRGLRACEALGIRVPRIIAYTEEGRRAELVLEALDDALALDQALNRPGAERQTILRNAAAVIGRLHHAGWTHGALYPAHILIGADNQVALLDLEKARHSPLRRRSDLSRFWRYCALAAEDTAVFLDSYLAARSGAGYR